jgi:hypothetical protein
MVLQTLQPIALYTPEVAMFVIMMAVGTAVVAGGKIALTIVRHDFVGKPIFNQPVHYPEDGRPVGRHIKTGFYIYMTQCLGGIQQHGPDVLLYLRVSPLYHRPVPGMQWVFCCSKITTIALSMCNAHK